MKTNRALALILSLTLFLNTSVRAGLVHRYSFTDGGKDSVGKVNGTLKGDGAKIADGKLTIKNSGTSGEEKISYLAFDSSLLPGGTSVTFMIWFTAEKNAGNFPRLLNIGAKEGSEGRAFIYVTPHTEGGSARAAISAGDTSNRVFVDNEGLDDGKPHMMAVVIDGAAKKLHVFIDGREPTAATDLGENTLDKVQPKDNWIGRSSFDNDEGLTGSIDELRVYDTAMSAEEIAAAQKAGPDSK